MKEEKAMILIAGLILVIILSIIVVQKYQKSKRSGNPQVPLLIFAYIAGSIIFISSFYITFKGPEWCNYDLISSKKYALSYKTNKYGYKWEMDGTINSKFTFYYLDGKEEKTLELPSKYVTILDNGFTGLITIETYCTSRLESVLFIQPLIKYKVITKL